jgi:hypothetical protein
MNIQKLEQRLKFLNKQLDKKLFDEEDSETIHIQKEIDRLELSIFLAKEKENEA